MDEGLFIRQQQRLYKAVARDGDLRSLEEQSSPNAAHLEGEPAACIRIYLMPSAERSGTRTIAFHRRFPGLQ
jgi:hypothetical protein